MRFTSSRVNWSKPSRRTGDATRMAIASPKVLARFPGAKLDRLEARHAWLDRPSLLMVGDHVTLGGEADAETELDVSEAQKKAPDSKAGTGCVHTAPGHGHDDFVIGKRYGLEIYCPVDNAGRFTPEVEHFAGQRVFDANDQIVDFMRERGVLLFSEKYEHRYPHCWRCKNPVIFRATPQWFIAMDQAHRGSRRKGRRRSRSKQLHRQLAGKRFCASLRGAAKREIERVNWIPAWGVDRMRNMLKGRPDWCVSRQRVWGVSIPVFYCAKCTEAVADPAVINHVADVFERESGDAWYTHDAKELVAAGLHVQRMWRPTSGPKKLTFSTFGSTVARRRSPCSRIVKSCAGPRMFTSKAAISFAVGSIRR